MKMKNIIIPLLTLAFGMSAYGQGTTISIDDLMSGCRHVASLQDCNNSLKADIEQMSDSLIAANQKWIQICESYINSSDQTVEDYEKLISLTDSVAESDLRQRLVNAKNVIEASSPIVSDERIPSEKPKDSDPVIIISSGKDGEKPEIEVEDLRGEIEEIKVDEVPAVKEKADDDDKDGLDEQNKKTKSFDGTY